MDNAVGPLGYCVYIILHIRQFTLACVTTWPISFGTQAVFPSSLSKY